MEVRLFLVLMALGYVFGKSTEAAHYRRIRRREAMYVKFPLTSTRQMPEGSRDCCVLSGTVVISDDFFKRVCAFFKSILGGRLSSIESLLDRARREATLRLKEAAMRNGYQGVVHFQLETSDLSDEEERGSAGAVHITAFGTAYRLPAPKHPNP